MEELRRLCIIFFFLVVLLPIVTTTAQSSAQPPFNDTKLLSTNFNPSLSIVIVVLISAFFYIYLRQCSDAGGSLAAAVRGLDPHILATIPTLVYSEVKEHKIGKTALECAVCITEFDDDDALRLLPRCSHVFHPDCIDAWLANHVTCPLCRSNLEDLTADEAAAAAPPTAAKPPEMVVVEVDGGTGEEEEERKAELARIASRRRGSGKPLQRFPRSHSTGHSVESHDRFTLRLPEQVHREIVAAGRARRAESLRGFPVAGGEGSSRSSRAGRIRFGRSGRWPSFFVRSLSMKVPASVRCGDGDWSMKKKAAEFAGDEAAIDRV